MGWTCYTGPEIIYTQYFKFYVSISNLQLWIHKQSVLRPLNIEVSGEGDAVVLVIDPEDLVNVNTDIDLVDAFSDWELEL